MSYTNARGEVIEDLPSIRMIDLAKRARLVKWKLTLRPSYSSDDIASKRRINKRLIETGGDVTIKEAEKAGHPFSDAVVRSRKARNKP